MTVTHEPERVHGSVSWAAFWIGLGIAIGGSDIVARWFFG